MSFDAARDCIDVRRLPKVADKCKHFFRGMGRSPYLTSVGIRLTMKAPNGNHTTMNTTKKKRLVGSRLGVYANISNKTHARLQKRAEASHLSAAKYTGVAVEFFMDLEDAFGGPMTDQFRQMILRNVGGMAAKLERALQ